jgi:hypothetical protein
MSQGIDQILQDFPFLDNRVIAQEPYLYDVLKEIRTTQQAVVKNKATRLATRDVLKTSREIKLPYTPARDKNIDYLIDLALQRYAGMSARLSPSASPLTRTAKNFLQGRRGILY